MITYEQIIEAGEGIDFDNLKFPIYRKDESNSEWYRFDSAKELVSIRINNVVGMGLSRETPDSVFIKIYSFAVQCSREEFDASLMKIAIQNAENSIRENDVIKMMLCYSKLKEYEL